MRSWGSGGAQSEDLSGNFAKRFVRIVGVPGARAQGRYLVPE